MSSTPAMRQRRFWLASSFLYRSYRSAFPARRRSRRQQSNCHRSRSPRPPTRTGPAPRPTYDEGIDLAPRRAGGAPSTGTQPAAGTGSDVASQSAAQGCGRKRRPAILRHRRHGVDRYYRRRYRAFARTNVAGNHRANARRAADQPVWRRQRRQDQRRPPRLRRVRHLKYPGAHQWPKAQRHRHGRRRFFDHSARFDRAHRNHARQQRRGAVRR